VWTKIVFNSVSWRRPGRSDTFPKASLYTSPIETRQRSVKPTEGTSPVTGSVESSTADHVDSKLCLTVRHKITSIVMRVHTVFNQTICGTNEGHAISISCMSVGHPLTRLLRDCLWLLLMLLLRGLRSSTCSPRDSGYLCARHTVDGSRWL
jgi:hypothetical protein